MIAPKIQTHHNLRRGFSLIEVSIVLIVMAIVLGGVWVYSHHAFENARRQQLTEELLTIVNNVRSLYVGQANICGPFDSLTAKLVAQNAIPSTMLGPGAPTCTNVGPPAGVCVVTPWGTGTHPTDGSFAIEGGTDGPALATPCAAANVRQQFTIELRDLPIDSCVSIATQDSGASAPSGLQDVLINGVSAVGAGTLPVPVAFAAANCGAAATIDFVYRLQPGNF